MDSEKGDHENVSIDHDGISYILFYICMQYSITPSKACTKDNEGESVYNPAKPLSIWLCKSSSWQPYE